MDYILPDKIYDVLKWIAVVLLPTIGWAVGELLPDFEIDPYVYVHVIDVAGMFIGALIGVSQLTAKSKE